MIKRLTSIVVSLHLLFILFLLFVTQPLATQKTHRVKVRTVRPATVAKTQITSSSQAPQRHERQAMSAKAQFSPAPKQRSQPHNPSDPSKRTAKRRSPQKISPSKKTNIIEKEKPIKKIEDSKQNDPLVSIWSEIDQALAKIEAKSYPKENPLSGASQRSSPAGDPTTALGGLADMGGPSLDTNEKIVESGVESALVGFLHDTLRLPEVGEVKIKLTIKKDGTVSNIVVMNAESQKNRIYLQYHLPGLQFPMQLDEEKTWTLIFYNEI